MLFTVTYSLVYEIETKYVCENFYHYPQDSKFFDPVNITVIGKMNNGFKVKIVELKSKMVLEDYGSMVLEDDGIRRLLGDGINSLAYFHKDT